MSELKSAWELSLERTKDVVSKANRNLTDSQKKKIAEIRQDYKAKIADKDVSVQHKIKKLADRVPPESLEAEKEILLAVFAEEKEKLEKEMEAEIESFYSEK